MQYPSQQPQQQPPTQYPPPGPQPQQPWGQPPTQSQPLPQGQHPYGQPPPYQSPQQNGPQSPMHPGQFQSPSYTQPQFYVNQPQGQPQSQAARLQRWAFIFILVSSLVAFVYISKGFTGSVPLSTSTATDTMKAYCNALKNHDYQTAYSLFSTPNTQFPDEQSLASGLDGADKTFGGLTDCFVYSVNENDSSGVANSPFSLTYGDGTELFLNARLANEGGTWKITQINS